MLIKDIYSSGILFEIGDSHCIIYFLKKKRVPLELVTGYTIVRGDEELIKSILQQLVGPDREKFTRLLILTDYLPKPRRGKVIGSFLKGGEISKVLKAVYFGLNNIYSARSAQRRASKVVGELISMGAVAKTDTWASKILRLEEAIFWEKLLSPGVK